MWRRRKKNAKLEMLEGQKNVVLLKKEFPLDWKDGKKSKETKHETNL